MSYFLSVDNGGDVASGVLYDEKEQGIDPIPQEPPVFVEGSAVVYELVLQAHLDIAPFHCTKNKFT
jgi:hypothetical protein